MNGTVGIKLKSKTDGGREFLQGVEGCAATIGDLGTGFGIAQNRIDTGLLATRRSMTWVNGPTQIRCRMVSGGTPVAGNRLFVVLNAPSDPYADTELADPVGPNANTERYTIYPVSSAPDGLVISSVTPITRIDYVLDNAEAGAQLIVEGA